MVRNRTAWKVPEEDKVDPAAVAEATKDSRCQDCRHAMLVRVGGSQIAYCKQIMQPMGNVVACSDFEEGHEGP